MALSTHRLRDGGSQCIQTQKLPQKLLCSVVVALVFVLLQEFSIGAVFLMVLSLPIVLASSFYLALPIIVFFRVRPVASQAKIVPVDADSLTEEQTLFFAETAASFAEAGLQPTGGTFRSTVEGAPGEAIVQLFLDRDAGDAAIASFTTTPLTKSVVSRESQLQMYSELGDGTFFVVMNAPAMAIRNANRVLNRLPSIKNAAALTRIHRRIVDRERHSVVRRYPEQAEREPQKYLEELGARQAALRVKEGWGRLSADGKWVTYTWKCYLLAYGAIWPFKQIFQAWVRLTERRLLAKLARESAGRLGS